MKVTLTPALRAFLHEAAADRTLSQALRSAAGNWVEAAAAPWDVLRDLCTAVRAARPGASGPWLHELCAGGGLDLPAPPPRARTKTPQLEAHLEQLRRKLEQDAYDRMVRDVTEKERAERARQEGGLRTFRQQISFGLHIVVMMGTFYAFGHALGMYLNRGSRLFPLAVGLVSMVGALLLETVLFIIRTTTPPRLDIDLPEKARPGRQQPAAAQQQAAQQQRQGRQGGRGAAPAKPVAPLHHHHQQQQQQPPQQQQQPKPAVAKKED